MQNPTETTAATATEAVNKRSSKPLKKISFFPTVTVVLIPECKEFIAAGLAKELWYTSEEYAQFKQEACEELQQLIAKQAALGETIDALEAYKRMYQSGSTPTLK